MDENTLLNNNKHREYFANEEKIRIALELLNQVLKATKQESKEWMEYRRMRSSMGDFSADMHESVASRQLSHKHWLEALKKILEYPWISISIPKPTKPNARLTNLDLAKLDLKIKEALELLNKIIEDKEKSIKVSQSCFGTWIPNDLSMTGRVAGTVHSYKKELAKIKKILV